MNCSHIFLDQSPKAKEIKAKINKWDLIKFKGFGKPKENTNKIQKPMEWEKIFVHDVTNKGFSSKIYKWLIELNIKKKN